MKRDEILQHLGITALNAMQQAAEQVIADGKSVMLLSPTGTGKTLAFLLPIVPSLNAESATLQCVIVVPTRELAQQSLAVFKQMKTPLRALCLHGGRPAMEEHRKIKEVQPQLVFATPGRLNDHFDKGNLFGGTATRLVIDEFDKCLELGFEADMLHIVQRLSHVRQLILTSATSAAEIPDFIAGYGGSPRDFQLLDFTTPHAGDDSRITVRVVRSEQKDKLGTLAQLLSACSGQTIVFVAHRKSVERVAAYLCECGFVVERYHGGMEQERRERCLYRFRAGGASVLVATDLAARGLDIPEVDTVVHYHLPQREADFLHRTGRTGRWERTGNTYLLQGPDEELPDFVGQVDYLPLDTTAPVKPVAPRFVAVYIGRGKREKLSKTDIVGFFCKKGGLRAADIGRIDVAEHQSYVAIAAPKAKEALRRVAGEKIKGMKTLVALMRD